MTTPPVTGWESWAPPLDPPVTGGMDYTVAQVIADATLWPANPHLTAALQWEAHASTLEPTQPVSTVSTGAQSVGFNPAAPTGPYGVAIRQAQWHRSFLADTYSVPMVTSSELEEYVETGVSPVLMSPQPVVWGPDDTGGG